MWKYIINIVVSVLTPLENLSGGDLVHVVPAQKQPHWRRKKHTPTP